MTNRTQNGITAEDMMMMVKMMTMTTEKMIVAEAFEKKSRSQLNKQQLLTSQAIPMHKTMAAGERMIIKTDIEELTVIVVRIGMVEIVETEIGIETEIERDIAMVD
jgi:hypothetical protein